MAILKRALIVLFVILLVPVVVLAAAFFYLTTAPGLATIASLTNKYASSDDTKVSVGKIEGSFPTDLTLKDVKLSDRKGEWATVSSARVAWSPLQLWSRKLVINAVEVGTVNIAREPEYEQKNEPVAPPDPNAPLLPELPIEIHLDRFALSELNLAAPVIGVPAKLAASASATLRQPKEGVAAQFELKRIDETPGQISGRARFIPDGQRIEISLRGSEPAGGLIARVAQIPGLPPIDLGIEGAGTLDSLRTQLVLTAGDQGRVDGAADVTREGKTRRVKVGLNGDVGRIVQPQYAELMSGATKISAEAVVPDSGPIQLIDATVDAPAARLGARGLVDPDKETIDVSYDLHAGDAKRFANVVPFDAKWTSLSLHGTAKGPLNHPEIKATIDGGGLESSQGGAQTAQIVLTATPNGPLSKDDTKIAAVVDAKADGVKFPDDRVLFSFGRTFTLSAAATSDLKGNADIKRADVKLANAAASYVGTVSPDAAKGKAKLTATDLSTLAPLVGQPIAGAVDLGADIDIAFDLSRLGVSVDGSGSGLKTGIDQVDALSGGSLSIKGGVERGQEGSFTFKGVDLSGKHVSLTADGSATRERADAKVAAEVDDLALIDPRAAGKATINADFSGKLADLAMKGVLEIPDGRALDRPLKDVKITIDADKLMGDVGAKVALAGTLDGKALDGGWRLITEPSGQRRIEDLDLKIASTSVKGAVTVSPNALANGNLTISAPDLSEVGALALTEMAGAIDADIALSVENDKQKAVIKAKGGDIVTPGAKVGSLDIDATVTDPTGAVKIDGAVNGAGIAVGDQVIDTLALTTQGAPDGMDVKLDMGAQGSKANAIARVAYGPNETKIDLSRLDLAGGGKTAALSGPARVRIVGSEVAIDTFSLRSGEGGVLNVTGRAGRELDLAVGLRELPLALGNAFTPGLDLKGMVEGDARITGAAGSPTANFDVRGADISIAKLRDAKIPPLGFTTKGKLEGQTITTDTSVSGAGGLSVTANGSAPIGEGDLDMTVGVRSLPLSIANAFVDGIGLGGKLEADAHFTGPVKKPVGTYRAKVSDFTSARAQGVPAVSIDATGRIEDARVTTDTRISGGGGISASAKGSAPLGQGDIDMDVAIAELPLALANAFAPDLGLRGTLKGGAKIAGPTSAPRGNYDLQIVDLVTAKAVGVPALNITTKGELDGPRVTTDTAITGGGGLNVTAKGAAPIGPGDLDMAVTIRELPLAIANAVQPSLGLGGTLKGDAKIVGPIAAPRGTYALAIEDLSTAMARGLPALKVDARGALDGAGRVNTATTVTGGGLDIAADGSAPIGDGDLDMTVAIRQVPLKLINAFAPDVAVDGGLQGTVKLTGPVAKPGGTYDLTIANLTSKKASGVAPLGVVAKGTLDPKTVTTDATITGGGGVEASAKGSAPLGDGPIDMAVMVRAFPLAIANAFAPDLGLGGVMKGDLKMTGPIKAPVGSYDLTIADLVAAQAKGVPPIQVATKGQMQGDRVTTDTTINGAEGLSLLAQGSAPLKQGDLDMKVAIRELPLALANGFKPELGLKGVLRGDATVTGPVAAPRGSYDLKISDLTSAAAVGVPALEVATKGELQGDRVTTDTNISGGGGIQASAKGSAPLGDGDLDMALMIRELPLALANAFKSDLGLAGVLTGDAKVQGPLKAPRGTYDLKVDGLTTARAKGVPALAITTNGALEGERVTTDTAVSGGGGVNITAKGSAPISGTGAIDMTVGIREVPLALANAFQSDLGLGGKLQGDARVAGTIAAPQGTYDLSVVDLTSAKAKGVPPLQISSKGAMEGQRVTTDTAVSGGGGVKINAQGAIPLGATGDLDLAVDIAEVPLSIANGFSPGLGLGGKLTGAAKATGPLKAPNGNYDLRITGLTAAQAKGVPPLQVVSKGDLQGGGVTTDTAITSAGGMRVTAKGSAPLSSTGPLDLGVVIRDVPLSLANGFSPGLGANGTLQGESKINGTISAPTGTYSIKVTGLSTQATRGAGVPAAQIDSKGRLLGKSVETDTVVTAASGLRVTARGTAPLGAGNMDLAVVGRAPLAFLNDTLAVSGDRIDGTASFDVKIGGPTSAPRVNGTGKLSGASYSNRAAGLQLRGMEASVSASGTNIDVTSLRATTRNGGTISGSGRVAVNPAAGFPGEINFRANNAELVGTDIVTAVTDADLKLQGPLARRPVVKGTIRTRSIEIQIPDRLPAQYTPLPDVKHKAAPPAVRRQLAALNTGKGKGGKNDAFLATLDIDVQANDHIFIRGMGMQAEAGGQIKITGTSSDPQPVGAFDLRSGRSRIDVIGHRLDFTRGNISFAGDLDPTLDFLAETQAKDITAQVVITGVASRPKIEFTSNPQVPQDEVLSRLLFNKASGELSPSQAITLAQAVAQYSGAGGGGGGPLESLRKGLGVDSLDISAGGGVGVGRYIADNIYLGVKGGARPEDSGVTVDIDLTKNIKARAEAGAGGNTAAGVAIQWDY